LKKELFFRRYDVDREDVINRIVQEKGTDAIPVLIEQLESADPQVSDIADEALMLLAYEGKDIILNHFKERFSLKKRDDVTLLYLAQILAHIKSPEIVPYIQKMFDMFSDERAAPLLIECLLKITGDKKYLDMLYAYSQDIEFEEIIIMALGDFPSKDSLDKLMKLYELSSDKSIKSLILESTLKILFSDFELVSYVNQRNPEISEKLQWALKNTNF